MPRPPTTVTRAMFAELVAQWRTAGRAPRRRWMQQRVTLHEAADLTGLAYNTLRVYRRQGQLPAGHPDGGWQIRDLARWRAASRTQNVPPRRQGSGQGTRWPGWDVHLPALQDYVDRVTGQGQPVIITEAAAELGVEKGLARKLLRYTGALPHRHTDKELIPFLGGVAAHEGRRLTLVELMGILACNEIKITRPRASRLYLAAGGRLLTMDSAECAPLESLRWDGLVTPAQIAAGYQVSQAVVSQARKRRNDGHPPLLTPVKWENRRPLYDPATLTTRKDLHAGPVQKGHPLAAELLTRGRRALLIGEAILARRRAARDHVRRGQERVRRGCGVVVRA